MKKAINLHQLGLLNLIGKKIVAIKGSKRRKNQTENIEAEYILLNDKQSIVMPEDSDYYGVRFKLVKNKEWWKDIMENHDKYGDATDCYWWDNY
jgi:hypothetical protein